MARQQLGKRKVLSLREQFPELDIIAALVRGGTDHRIDLCLRDNRVFHLFKDGSLKESELEHLMESVIDGE